ncbi:hypothetical protein [Bacillus sp. JJ722]|uniref:hypothetical protein n=1 Tax=Bacillus sp. JJ722 TaxID=3122973 RepID=UPI002FFDED17
MMAFEPLIPVGGSTTESKGVQISTNNLSLVDEEGNTYENLTVNAGDGILIPVFSIDLAEESPEKQFFEYYVGLPENIVGEKLEVQLSSDEGEPFIFSNEFDVSEKEDYETEINDAGVEVATDVDLIKEVTKVLEENHQGGFNRLELIVKPDSENQFYINIYTLNENNGMTTMDMYPYNRLYDAETKQIIKE